MKSKILIAVLFALFIVSFVSAENIAVSTTSLTFSGSTTQNTFTVSNTNQSALLTVSIPAQVTVTGENGYQAIFNVAGDRTNINYSSPRTFTLTPVSTIDYSNFILEKSYSTNLNVVSGSETKTVSVIVSQASYCSAGNKGNLRISTEIYNRGFGEDTTWYPTDEIAVEVTVENRLSEKINDVVVQWGLYDKTTGEFIIEDNEKSFDITKNDEKTITFNFTLDPEDLTDIDSSDDFILYVKAYSEDLGEDVQCNYESQGISIAQDDDFVILSDIKIADATQCGNTETVTAKVWNIGDNDESDIQVSVTNLALGLKNKLINVGDLDVYDNDKISFDFEIPKNATETTYTLEFRVLDEDGNVFENDDNDQALFRKTIKVEGNCEAVKSVNLVATVNSADTITAGKEFSVKATLKNTGAADTTYAILADGYNSWATIKSIEPSSLTLGSGESNDVVITLIPNKDVKGTNEFAVQAVYNGLVTEQTLSVDVKPASSFFSGFSFSNMMNENWFIWAVAALNIILVVLIVVIAVRIVKK
ncbi:MAG: putative S-layer protein [Candidatus Pacearchaeota archaeon]|jgi:hypothetical protein